MKTITELQAELAKGIYDNKLSELYCRPAGELQYYRERINRILEGYQSQFGKSPEAAVSVFSAPGRTELGGNHTDHQGGKVLTGSVDLDALACAAPNGENIVRLYSEGFGLTAIDCNDLSPKPNEKNGTAALLRGTLAGIAQKGYEIRGFDAYVTSDVPGGSGLSSSACIEILLAAIVNGFFCEGKLSAVEMAQVGKFAENVYFGKPSGLLDQIGCAFGGVVAVDFADAANPICEQVEFDVAKAGYAMCIIDSGADHSGLTDFYAAIPAEMRAVAACFGKEILSEVAECEVIDRLPELAQKCGDRAVLRALHYYGDCARVPRQVEALKKEDYSEYLRLVNESGESSALCLQNISTFADVQCQPVTAALALAKYALRGEGAVRVHGGGFAGTIQAYVPLSRLDAFTEVMEHYLGRGACRVTYIRPIGACVLM